MTYPPTELVAAIDLVDCGIQGALNGADIKSVSRVGDLENKISIGTASVFVAKQLFKENAPYNVQVVDGVTTFVMSYNFLQEARRHFSGEQTEATSTFSPLELEFYNTYIDYEDGIITPIELAAPLTVLQTWVADEITSTPHPELLRTYPTTHKWNKTLKLTI